MTASSMTARTERTSNSEELIPPWAGIFTASLAEGKTPHKAIRTATGGWCGIIVSGRAIGTGLSANEVVLESITRRKAHPSEHSRVKKSTTMS